MKILALDFATKTGFAHSDGESGSWDLKAKRDQSLSIRLLNLKRNLDVVLRDKGVDLVVFEAVRFAGMSNGLIPCAELQGVVKAWCEEHNIPYKGYASTTIKFHAVGSGKGKGRKHSNKEAMIDAAERKWKRAFEDDDEVDALWLLDLAMGEFCADRNSNQGFSETRKTEGPV